MPVICRYSAGRSISRGIGLRFRLVATLLLAPLAIALITCPIHAQEDKRGEQYNKDIDDFESQYNRIESSSGGKERLVSGLRSLIAKYPSFPRNIELEIKLADVYTHKPNPDFGKELESLESAIRSYPPDAPGMYDLLLHTAERYVGRTSSNRVDTKAPARARELLERVASEHPEIPYVILYSQTLLGRLAEVLGNYGEANEHFLAGSRFEFTGQETDRERFRLTIYYEECAGSAIRTFVEMNGDLFAKSKLKAFDEYLKEHPRLALINGLESMRRRQFLEEAVSREQEESARNVLTAITEDNLQHVAKASQAGLPSAAPVDSRNAQPDELSAKNPADMPIHSKRLSYCEFAAGILAILAAAILRKARKRRSGRKSTE